jgi:hypothetical protein
MHTGSQKGRRNSSSALELASPVSYNLILGGVLIWGFGLNWFFLRFLSFSWLDRFEPSLVGVIYAAVCGLGYLCYKNSGNYVLSFLGYNLVALPFGVVLSFFLRAFDPTFVLKSMLAAGLVTLVMIALGASFPGFFAHTARTVAVALAAGFSYKLVDGLLFRQAFSVFDWLSALVFSAFIGGYWARANHSPKTLNNAVDTAAAMYMDLILLFLLILTRGAKKKI